MEKLYGVVNSRLRIRPRMLVDVSEISSTTTVLGDNVSMPIGIAPTAMQKMAHPQGECANARGTVKSYQNSYIHKSIQKKVF